VKPLFSAVVDSVHKDVVHGGTTLQVSMATWWE